MARNWGLLAVCASSLLLSACYVPASYSNGGYSRSYGAGSPSSYAAGNTAVAGVPQPASGSAPQNAAVPMPRPLPTIAPGPVAAPVAKPNAASVPPAGTTVADAATPSEPVSSEPRFSGLIALPTLVLPVRQNWSSGKCPSVAVTFTGKAQSHEVPVAESASYEEVQQFRDGDYAEMAECFCAKTGDLSNISKVAATTVMGEMARQFTDQLYMQTRNISFVETSPFGAYSQLEASSENPSTLRATLRVYWRGQCSVRLAVVSTPMTAQRAAEFLNSLREIKGSKFLEADVPLAAPIEPVTKTALPPLGKRPAVSSTSLDLEQEMKQKGVDGSDTAPAQDPTLVASAAPDQITLGATAPDPSANQNAASRLRQLQELKRKGLINEAEYDVKRQTILNGL